MLKWILLSWQRSMRNLSRAFLTRAHLTVWLVPRVTQIGRLKPWWTIFIEFWRLEGPFSAFRGVHQKLDSTFYKTRQPYPGMLKYKKYRKSLWPNRLWLQRQDLSTRTEIMEWWLRYQILQVWQQLTRLTSNRRVPTSMCTFAQRNIEIQLI